MNKEYISIFKPQRVRKLLKKGFNIYDIKADKIREEARKCNNTMKVIAVDNKNNQFEL